MGVPAERIYTDKGLTGTHRNRSGLDQALAAVRAGDTLVVPKLDRLARSVPDARAIGDSLVARGVKLRVGGILYDPADPMGKMFFNILCRSISVQAVPCRDQLVSQDLRLRDELALHKARYDRRSIVARLFQVITCYRESAIHIGRRCRRTSAHIRQG